MNKLYAVIDGATIDDLGQILKEKDAHYGLIPPEPIDEAIREYLPYLVECNDDIKVWLTGLDVRWGVYFSGNVSFVAARKHFRSLLKIKIDGHVNYFRFYEPESLDAMWSRLTDWQKRSFVGVFDEVISQDNTAYTVTKAEHYAPMLQLSQDDILFISQSRSEKIKSFVANKISALDIDCDIGDIQQILDYLMLIGLTNQDLMYEVCRYIFEHDLKKRDKYKMIFSPRDNETATYRAESVLMGLC
ncbi:DUF4123 domain-containing protein [Photobacterium damselae]|uniref:DUF4123 domain-containing protein n=1 Tax=Photobacterium damselae TaxID=38293 RepID=UPI0025432753